MVYLKCVDAKITNVEMLKNDILKSRDKLSKYIPNLDLLGFVIFAT